MTRQKRIIVNTSLIVLAIAPIVLYAYEYGPDPGYSAAPGDNPTGCIDPSLGCHLGTPNSGTGSVKIVASGGTSYVPGQTQTITVTIADATEKKYGFQLSARVDSAPKTTAAGLLTPGTDGYTQTLCADSSNAPATGCTSKNGGTLEWIEHTLSGYYASNATPGSYTYKFTWTPPTTNVGTVTLYAAGNAVTGNLVVTGTFTYLTSLQLSPSTGSTSTPTVTAVSNDASFASTVATGSWVAVFGTNLAPAGDSRLWNPSTEIVGGVLPTALDGTSVMVNGKKAAVEYISPTQINIQPPDDTAVGPVPVVVTANGATSATFTATYAQFAPGLFPGAAAPFIVAQHGVGNSYVTSASPAQPNEVIVLWGTGFGPAKPTVPAGQVFTGQNPLANTVTATIGGQPATVQFAGVVGAGLVQINVQVPAGISAGNAAVVLSVGGVSTQSTNNMIPVQ
jgi:uncharacterized protein (TIGR03437 family)